MHKKLSTELNPNIIYRANVSNDANNDKKFSSVSQTNPLKKGTETIQRTLNMKKMRIALNWLNISGN